MQDTKIAATPSNPPKDSEQHVIYTELHKESPQARTSKWGVGKATPLLMISCYVFAFLVALTHLLLFRFLDGKPVDGHHVPPQSYVSTISNLLVTTFSWAINMSLGSAFTQYLWYLLRRSSLKVSTIEAMYGMQGNPLQSLRPNVMKSAFVLGILSWFIWAISIVTTFPPGALIVGPIVRFSNKTQPVPTFNSTFVGNGSGIAASSFTLDQFDPTFTDRFVPFSQIGIYSHTLARLTTQIMIAGAPSTMTSPCGANCSYTLTFQAPSLQCAPLEINYDILDENFAMGNPAFEGLVFDPYLALSLPAGDVDPSGSILPSRFTFTTYDILGINSSNFDHPAIAVRANILKCTPASTTYTAEYNYTSNVLTTIISNDSVRDITNLSAPAQGLDGVFFPGSVSQQGLDSGIWVFENEPLLWTDGWLAWYGNLQLMAIINSMTNSLNGSYPVSISKPIRDDSSGTLPAAWGLGDGVWQLDVGWSDSQSTLPTANYLKNTIAAETKLNDYFGQYNLTLNVAALDAYGQVGTPIHFTMTAEMFNEFLLNITLSMIGEIGHWSTPTTVTTWAAVDSFQFSFPSHLIIPYALLLLLALPILALGAWSLRENGVPAMGGSFIQTCMTTTGSVEFEKAVAGSCLGGSRNMTKELGDLKIRFGELSGGGSREKEEGAVKRAGFGTEEEVTPLVKSKLYGIK